MKRKRGKRRSTIIFLEQQRQINADWKSKTNEEQLKLIKKRSEELLNN